MARETPVSNERGALSRLVIAVGLPRHNNGRVGLSATVVFATGAARIKACERVHDGRNEHREGNTQTSASTKNRQSRRCLPPRARHCFRPNSATRDAERQTNSRCEVARYGRVASSQ